MTQTDISNGFIPFDPDLVDEERGRKVFILSIVFTVLVLLSTTSRIAAKLLNKMDLRAADYFIIITLAFNLTANVFDIQSVYEGFGRHLQFLTRDQVLTLRRLGHYTTICVIISLWAVKLSICFFILALIRDVHRRIEWALYGLISVSTIGSICEGTFWGLQARPLRKLWEPDIAGEVFCDDTLVTIIIAFTAINSVIDLFYALSPIYLFGRLQISRGKKYILIGLTGSGLLVFTSSIIRVTFARDLHDPDTSWALSKVHLSSIVERNLAELIADLPASVILFRSVHRNARTLLSWGTWDSIKRVRTRGHSGPGDKSFSRGDRRPPFSGGEPAYCGEEDEIPLNDAPRISKDNIIIASSGPTIGMREHASGVLMNESEVNRA
ncbi:hypothetical protein GGS23DRAFT_603039 [Durotheca rogersii]|uniref:uncharacterized protein n=1 Tax=Durotheca rogersii TaxID=419775 RepID=UPI0022203B9D|nr:uncharacterized protein GGS23DRAFT_603039 [Durotheca rogersii]KAI5866819.1 hypothetical protein GGS23DRAFT_603039 [Durotheca rogersii]